MVVEQYKAVVPGSVMLLGEHAVLRYNNAVVASIDEKITAILIPQDNNKIKIQSELGNLEFDISEIKVFIPLSFVTAVITEFKNEIKTGFLLKITSKILIDRGYGSSAAVVVACVRVLSQWLRKKQLSNLDLFNISKKAMLNIQKRGSGADIAASIFGGVIKFCTNPLKIEKIKDKINLKLLYSGSKLPTPQVLEIIAKREEKNKEKFNKIFKAINNCVIDGIDAIRNNDLKKLGKIFNNQQIFMSELGVSNTALNNLLYKLNKTDGIMGAKISGSGLGDSVIGLLDYS